MFDEVLPHEKEVRARLLPHNKWYENEVIITRGNLKIPKTGFISIGDGLRWWLAHTEKHSAGDFTCNQCGERFAERIVHCGKPVERRWYQGNLDNPNRWEEYRRYTFWRFDPVQKQVPLYAEALLIIDSFNLPIWAFFVTVWYILTGQLVFPQKTGDILPYPPPYEPREYRYPKLKQDEKERSSIEISIDEYTTRTEWQDIWPVIKSVRDEMQERTGIKPSSRKRGAGEKWKEQINRWVEWYQLYGELGSIEEVANAWQKSHPEVSGHKANAPYTAEAIKNAIKQMEQMMRPKGK